MELNKVDLNKLATFLVIAESGAVTAAAERLSLTRSAVSHSLRALEDELGVPLFHRVGKRLVLTAQGKLLKRAISELRERLSTAFEQVLGLGREVRGLVRLGVFLGFSRFQLADAVNAFVGEHPNTSVRVAYGPQSFLIQQLLEGKLDMVLSVRPTGEQAARIRSERLSVRPLVLALKKSDQRPPRDFAQLARLSIVDYYQSDPLIDRWTRHHFGGRRVPAERIRVWAASTDLALELVLAGVGAAVIPRDIAAAFERQKQLQVIAGPGRPLLDHLWLNDLPGSDAVRALAAFREVLLRRLGTKSV
jgi:LysR family transcriptional regulator, low CO2-responsive transcriptional regulator